MSTYCKYHQTRHYGWDPVQWCDEIRNPPNSKDNMPQQFRLYWESRATGERQTGETYEHIQQADKARNSWRIEMLAEAEAAQDFERAAAIKCAEFGIEKICCTEKYME